MSTIFCMYFWSFHPPKDNEGRYYTHSGYQWLEIGLKIVHQNLSLFSQTRLSCPSILCLLERSAVYGLLLKDTLGTKRAPNWVWQNEGLLWNEGDDSKILSHCQKLQIKARAWVMLYGLCSTAQIRGSLMLSQASHVWTL